MSKSIQFVLTTPEELTETILAALDKRITKLSKESAKPLYVEYLTRQETATLLKKDLSTIHHWTKKGTLQAFYIEGSVLYKRSQIESVVKSLS